MSLAIILGDPHLGKSIATGRVSVGATLNSRIADQLALLDHVLDRAIELHADYIIITGDVYEDPKPKTELITMFLSWLKKCQIHGVQVHIIAGNHDILRSGYIYTSALDIITEADLPNTTVYKSIDTVIIDTTAFTFLPFRDRKSFGSVSNAEALALLGDGMRYELAGIPITYQKIVVGHLALEGSIPIGDEIDDLTNELFCPVSMFAGYDFVWMGHVHRPQVIQTSPHLAHIGSMDISNFGETDHQKNIVVVDCEGHQPFFTEALPTRPLRKIALSVPKDTADPTAYIIQQITEQQTPLDKAIVRLEISLETAELPSLNRPLMEKYLNEQGVFNIAGISEHRKHIQVKKDDNNTIHSKMDVSSAIHTYADAYVDACMRESFIQLATDIHQSYREDSKD